METSHARRRRGPLDRLVNFFRDPDGVARFEEYSEAVGICKNCFDPRTTPRDAPRRHRRRRSSGSKYGSSTRVDKTYRYGSSDDEKRRKSKSKSKAPWVAAGVAGYGAAKLGESMMKRKEDFDDTYSVRTGEVQDSQAPWVSTGQQFGENSYAKEGEPSSSRIRTDGANAEYYERRKSKRRSSGSSTSSSESKLARAAGAAVVGGAIASGLRGERRRKRSQSPKKKYHHHKVSPRHSYVDLSTTAGAPGLGSFFSSPSDNRRKGKKQKSLFGLGNSSTSSSDADLAFGEGTVRRKNSHTKDRRQKDNGNVNSAILGLAATGAALAAASSASDSKKEKGRRRRSSRERRDDYDRKSKHGRRSSSQDDDSAWEDASGDELSDSALAYGSRLSARQSRESLDSKPATSKWGWGWNMGGKDKPSRESRPDSYDPPPNPYPGYDGPAYPQGSSDLPPMQNIYPLPTADPNVFDAARHGSNVSHMMNAPSTPGTSGPPLEHPQPFTPVSNSVYATTSPETQGAAASYYNTTPSTSAFVDASRDSIRDKSRYGPAVEETREQTRRKRADSSPARFSAAKGDRDSERPSNRRISSREYGSTVRFDLTDEQVERERNARKRDRRKSEDASEATNDFRKGDRRKSGSAKYEERDRRKSEPSQQDDDSRKQDRRRSDSSRASDVDYRKRDARKTESARNDDDYYAKRERRKSEDSKEDEESRRKSEKRRRAREQELKDEDDRQISERRSRDGDSTSVSDVTATVAGAAALAGVAAVLTRKSKDHDSENEDRKSRSRGSKQMPPDEPIEFTADGVIEPRKSSASKPPKVSIRIKRDPSPAQHDDYASFFVPPELVDHLKEHNEAAARARTPDHSGPPSPELVEIVPKGASREGEAESPLAPEPQETSKDKFSSFEYVPFGRRSSHNPSAVPWPVPLLGLVQPTPPQSPSVVALKSPPRRRKQDYSDDDSASESRDATSREVTHRAKDTPSAVDHSDDDGEGETEQWYSAETGPQPTADYNTSHVIEASVIEFESVREVSQSELEHKGPTMETDKWHPTEAETGEAWTSKEAVERHEDSGSRSRQSAVSALQDAQSVEDEESKREIADDDSREPDFTITKGKKGKKSKASQKAGKSQPEDEVVPAEIEPEKPAPWADFEERTPSHVSRSGSAVEQPPTPAALKEYLVESDSHEDPSRDTFSANNSFNDVDPTEETRNETAPVDDSWDGIPLSKKAKKKAAKERASKEKTEAAEAPEESTKDLPRDVILKEASSKLARQDPASSRHDSRGVDEAMNSESDGEDQALRDRARSKPEAADAPEDDQDSKDVVEELPAQFVKKKSKKEAKAEAKAEKKAKKKGKASKDVDFYESNPKEKRASGISQGSLDDSRSRDNAADGESGDEEQARDDFYDDQTLKDNDVSDEEVPTEASSRRERSESVSTSKGKTKKGGKEKSEISAKSKGRRPSESEVTVASSIVSDSKSTQEKSSPEKTSKDKKSKEKPTASKWASLSKMFAPSTVSVASGKSEKRDRDRDLARDEAESEPEEIASSRPKKKGQGPVDQEDSSEETLEGQDESEVRAIALQNGRDKTGSKRDSVVRADKATSSSEAESEQEAQGNGQVAGQSKRDAEQGSPHRHSEVRSADFFDNPQLTNSPTAVPLYFRRHQVSPGSARSPSVAVPKTMSLPSSPAVPRSRQPRPTSIEFRASEVRPLWLVERHSAAKIEQPQIEESYPSLPSSRTSSANPSMENLRQEIGDGVVPATSTGEHFVRHRPGGSTARQEESPRSPLLDSQTPTPVVREFPREISQDVKKEKPKYEFHSPSELLQDPAFQQESAVDEEAEVPAIDIAVQMAQLMFDLDHLPPLPESDGSLSPPTSERGLVTEFAIGNDRHSPSPGLAAGSTFRHPLLGKKLEDTVAEVPLMSLEKTSSRESLDETLHDVPESRGLVSPPAEDQLAVTSGSPVSPISRSMSPEIPAPKMSGAWVEPATIENDHSSPVASPIPYVSIFGEKKLESSASRAEAERDVETDRSLPIESSVSPFDRATSRSQTPVHSAEIPRPEKYEAAANRSAANDPSSPLASPAVSVEHVIFRRQSPGPIQVEAKESPPRPRVAPVELERSPDLIQHPDPVSRGLVLPLETDFHPPQRRDRSVSPTSSADDRSIEHPKAVKDMRTSSSAPAPHFSLEKSAPSSPQTPQRRQHALKSDSAHDFDAIPGAFPLAGLATLPKLDTSPIQERAVSPALSDRPQRVASPSPLRPAKSSPVQSTSTPNSVGRDVAPPVSRMNRSIEPRVSDGELRARFGTVAVAAAAMGYATRDKPRDRPSNSRDSSRSNESDRSLRRLGKGPHLGPTTARQVINPPFSPTDDDAYPIASSSTYDPVNDKGKGVVRDMSDIYVSL